MEAVTRPLRKDAERNRQRILAAAREVFAERGLDASLDDIARHADVGVGTVYRRFPDKDALIEALFEEGVQRFGAIADAALANPDPWEGLVGFFEATAGMQAVDRGLKEIMLGSRPGQERVQRMRDRIAPVVMQLMARAQAAGVVRADASFTDVPLINMMVGTVADAARETDPELWRRYLRLLLDGLRAQDAEPLPPALAGPADLDCVMRAWRPPRR